MVLKSVILRQLYKLILSPSAESVFFFVSFVLIYIKVGIGKNKDFFFIYVYVCNCMLHVWAHSWSWKGASDPPQLELQYSVSHMGARNLTQVPRKSSKVS